MVGGGCDLKRAVLEEISAFLEVFYSFLFSFSTTEHFAKMVWRQQTKAALAAT